MTPAEIEREARETAEMHAATATRRDFVSDAAIVPIAPRAAVVVREPGRYTSRGENIDQCVATREYGRIESDRNAEFCRKRFRRSYGD
jgi:hypothetical protein